MPPWFCKHLHNEGIQQQKHSYVVSGSTIFVKKSLTMHNKIVQTHTQTPAISFLSVSTRESHKETYTIFTEIVLIRAKSGGEKNKYLVLFKWINKFCFHALEFYLQWLKVKDSTGRISKTDVNNNKRQSSHRKNTQHDCYYSIANLTKLGTTNRRVPFLYGLRLDLAKRGI